MKLIHFAIVLSMISALSLGISGIAMATEPGNTYTTDPIKVGHAGSECAQVGTLLGKEFAYSWKWNEAAGQGAPNGSETANFTEHSNTITISNSTGSTFDWSSSPNGIAS